MARNNKVMLKAGKRIKDISTGINGTMDALYRSTYMSSPRQGKDLEDLNDKINSSIDKIVRRNEDTHGLSSVTSLYSRIAASNGGESDNTKVISTDLEKMFETGLMTDDLYGMFMSNAYLRELDNEIDTVCKYMPELEEALDVQRDCVLSADHFSKDFLSIETPNSGIEQTLFSERIKEIKKKYKLLPLVEEIYSHTSKYGEKFIYRVPYSTAIGKLLATKPDTSLVMPSRGINESSEFDGNTNSIFMLSMNKSECFICNENQKLQTSEATVITESVKHYPNGKDVTSIYSNGILGENESFNIGIEICKSGIIESAVYEYRDSIEKSNKFTEQSLASIHDHEVESINEAKAKNIQAKGNINIPSDPIDKRFLSNDGLISSNAKPVAVKAKGCVIKSIDRDRIIPIYIEQMCLGYYYFEIRSVEDNDTFMGFKSLFGDPLTNMRNNGGDRTSPFNAVDTERQDATIKYVAAQLSKFIDKQFVNANNDLAKEIYMILKYNDLFNTPSMDMIKVTFIPPEDIVHFFFKQDPKTHRGISDLEKGFIPAKIYSSLYITASIGNLTRGYDKRVYYVKQTVDTNIAKTLLTTISQIKQSNFGIRQFQNINNVLNITGRFNDFVIPTNASGEAPVQFEVMPGQEINVPTELMDQLKSMAVNSTGIPIEIIQARQSIDYAMQLTMSSSKVLRFCYKRQELYQEKLKELISPIYNYEYDDSVSLDIVLPPPTFINVTNTNQLIDNTKNLVQSMVDIELAGEEDEKLKAIYSTELFKYYIGTHIDISRHQDILDRCKLLLTKNTDESHSDGSGDEYNY